MRTPLALVPLLAGCLSGDGFEPFSPFADDATSDPLFGGLDEPVPQEVPHESAELTHRSAAFAQTRGVVVVDDEEAWAGMASMACLLQVSDGTIAADVDPAPFRDETVQDVGDDGVIATSRHRVHVFEPRGLFPTTGTTRVEEVIVARGADDGDVVTLAGGLEHDCTVRLGLEVGAPAYVLDAAACDDREGQGFTVDPSGPTVFVATPDGVVALDGSGRRQLEIGGDLLAWDAWSGLLYTATRGGAEIAAWSPTGAPVWTAEVGGPITRLRAMGPEQLAAALVREDGESRVWFVDATTGAPRQALVVHDEVLDVATAADGSGLGVVLADEVHFFSK